MLHSKLRGQSGQMSVELAVLMPVIIVVALVGYNLVRFIGACASFDRLALDAVVSQGVSPAGEQSEFSAVSQIEYCISEALALDCCSVKVSAKGGASKGSRGVLSIPGSPLLTTYTCTLSYTPWPSTLVFGGVSYRSPLALKHTRSIVADRFRSGVVV